MDMALCDSRKCESCQMYTADLNLCTGCTLYICTKCDTEFGCITCNKYGLTCHICGVESPPAICVICKKIVCDTDTIDCGARVCENCDDPESIYNYLLYESEMLGRCDCCKEFQLFSDTVNCDACAFDVCYLCIRSGVCLVCTDIPPEITCVACGSLIKTESKVDPLICIDCCP